MSDKSFGDHTHRSVVKNPLLSTVVTGLSLDDLTQKAVLLPVSPSQGVILTSDHTKQSSQNLAYAQHDKPIFLSGDADIPINALKNENPYDSNVKLDTDAPIKTVKSDDDFDVNEYFARLQGTRYVSAPIHSQIAKDRTASTEDNLEEINLNEPEKPQETQQSLTADIAQNFSQLPTVLPHVASAVFNSFSNMLSLKSREQTPYEDTKQASGYREVVRPDNKTVPLMSVEEPTRNIGPPPKELPIGGSGNYRISTKKKYAQIPGLSCGDTGQNIYSAPFNPNIQGGINSTQIEREKTVGKEDKKVNEKYQPYSNDEYNVSSVIPALSNYDGGQHFKAEYFNPIETNVQTNVIIGSNVHRKEETYDIFNPTEYVDQKASTVAVNQATSDAQSIFFDVSNKNEVDFNQPSVKPMINQNIDVLSLSSTPVVPPPPMFSNERTDKPIGKAILPPSVARRISANHPIIKTQPVIPAVVEKFFTPIPFNPEEPTSAVGVEDVHRLTESSVPMYSTPTIAPSVNDIHEPSTQFDTTNVPASSVFYTPTSDIQKLSAPYVSNTMKFQTTEPIIFTPTIHMQSTQLAAIPLSRPNKDSNEKSLLSHSVRIPEPTNVGLSLPASSAAVPSMSSSKPSNVELASSIFTQTSQIQHPMFDQSQPTFGALLSAQNTSLNIDTPVVSQPQPSTPSVLCNPYDIQNKNTLQADQAQCAILFFDPSTVKSEPSLPITESPKASNNLSYRMTKKKPQYYSGPIEGVGFINNYAKPDLPPIDSGSFAGTLFTPMQQANANTNIEPPSAPFNITKTTEVPPIPFDINKVQIQPEYNTSFDLSRKKTEVETQKPESKGFGIIGSLKSKLSSIDINKIQNSVTTFFDPAYNDVNTEEKQESAPNYDQNTYGQISHDQNNSFEIFIPTIEYKTIPKDQQMLEDTLYSYSQINQTQNPYSNQNHEQDRLTTSSYFSYPDQSITVQPTHTKASSNITSEPYFSNIKMNKFIIQKPKSNSNAAVNFTMPRCYETQDDDFSQNFNKKEPENVLLSNDELPENIAPTSVKTSDKRFFTKPINNQSFDITDHLLPNFSNFGLSVSSSTDTGVKGNTTEILQPCDEILPIPTLDIAKQDKLLKKVFDTEEKKIKEVSKQKSDYDPLLQNDSLDAGVNDPFMNIKPEKHSGQELEIRETNLLKSSSKNELPIVTVSSVPLFGLSTIFPEDEDIIYTKSSVIKAQRPYDKKAIAKFFDNIPPREVNIPPETDESKPFSITDFKPTDLKPKEIRLGNIKETESHINTCKTDLTKQLIDNITAPIQLSNPVEAPFTVSETVENRVQFDREQCEKISHITQDTIEELQKESVAKLLNKVPVYKWTRNSVWKNDNSLEDDEVDFKLMTSLETDTDYENNLKLYDEFVSNVVKEVKAQLNAMNENAQASEAAARQAENSRSNIAGNLDVNSIEIDAASYFTYAHIIEPSTSDDEDRVDVKEQVKFEDTGLKMESFTNRIERYKKKGDIKFDKTENRNTVNSSSLPMASYFDTGNYAAETHYKNTVCSPSSSNYMGSPSQPKRIPPGFEDEYQREMSGVFSQVTSDSKSDEPSVSDTSKQTSTNSTTDKKYTDDGFEFQSHLTNMVDDLESPEPKDIGTIPILARIFGTQNNDEIVDVEFNDTMAVRGSDQSTPSEPIDKFGHIDREYAKYHGTENFDRLNSYFASSSDAEQTRNFVGTSTGYDYVMENAKIIEKLHKDTKFQSTDNNVPYFDFMSDLTSVDNLELDSEQTDKIVNYFTLEYDNDVNVFLNERKIKNNCKLKSNDLNENKITEILKTENDGVTLINDTKLETNEIEDKDTEFLYTSLNKCEFCFDYLNINDSNYKIRKLMNESADSEKEIDNNMMQEEPKRSVVVNFDTYPLEDDTNEGTVVMNENRTTAEYTMVKHHWFYRVDIDDKSIWRGFSVIDSTALEDAFLDQNLTDETVVSTDGGRYDVNIVGRLRRPVYWNDKPTNVRRCSWFYKGTTDARYVPYTENVAEKLEEEYRHGVTTGEWHRQLILPNNELVVMHGPSVMVHFLHGGAADTISTSPLFTFGKRVYRNPVKIRVARDQPKNVDHLILLVHGAGEYRNQKEKNQSMSRPRVVRRGHDESEIEDTEPSSIDHLLLLCHGVGSACDMRFRNVEEVVDDFRATSLQLVQSHYRNSYENGVVSRVEVLPISWHSTLHSGENGVDRRLAQITLDSIPRLRNFTNDTVLDVLFYTSPVYCQTIINTVCTELNRIYSLFVKRNPEFKGGVSLGGHSLGSVILYDLLCHQRNESKEYLSKKKFVNESGSTGQPNVKYPKLVFEPAALYALGSPIAIFECIRGVESLGMDFSLPTCKNFFNIFHPYDPIAYRIEPLINPLLRDVKPFLVPHHKGRKRMHLELKDTMVRVGADLKQKFIESIKTTWNKWKTQTPTDGHLEKVLEEEMEKENLNEEKKEESTQNETATPDMLGKLNDGRRIDYVLQEAPLEVINEYLFAMSSHVGYWESEDTMLLMLREIYDILGVQPDSTIPQQNMSVQRTRTIKQDETIVIDQPTTSRDCQ